MAGIYVIAGHAQFASTSGTGQRTLRLRVNGTTMIGSARVPAATGVTVFVSAVAVYALAAGDYVELVAHQNSGGSLDVNASGNDSPEFSIHLLART